MDDNNKRAREREHDWDELISEQASELFELDKVSWSILHVMAINGPQTIYSLYREIPEVSQSAIRRRFTGSDKFIGLDKGGFILPILNLPYHEYKNKYKKFYFLDFKGFLASLALTGLTSIFYFSKVTEFFEKKGSRRLREAFTDFTQIEIAAWFQTHIENGIPLTNLKMPYLYFNGTRNIETIFGDIKSSLFPIIPETVLDPTHDKIEEITREERMYSDTWYDLIEKKQQAKIELEEELEKYEPSMKNMVSRWFELMILLMSLSARQRYAEKEI